jgi:uncharacterized DUF497 family protein
MFFEWDVWKASANLEKHGVSFDDVRSFEVAEAFVRRDVRFAYDEPRWIAVGWLRQRLHVLVFTWRETETLRVISFRKANAREVKNYAEAKARLDQSG